MVTPRISYAHLLAEPNPKHVESLLKFFEAGRSKRGTGGLGVEIEHLPVHDADDTAVSYYEPNGIEAFLKRLAPYYDESKEYWENGHLVGLAREALRCRSNRAARWRLPSACFMSRATSTACTPTSGVRRTRSSRSWLPFRQLRIPAEVEFRRRAGQSERPL